MSDLRICCPSMDPLYDHEVIDVDFTTEISNKMRIPNRLSLAISDYPQSDRYGATEVPQRIVLTGSDRQKEPFLTREAMQTSLDYRPSLQAPPESLVIQKVEFPDVSKRSSRNRQSRRFYASERSLFQGNAPPVENELTVVANDQFNELNNSSHNDLEAQLHSLVLRVSALESAAHRHSRRELLAFVLIGTYFLLKLSRSLLNAST